MDEEVVRNAPDEDQKGEREDYRHDDEIHDADDARGAAADELGEGHISRRPRAPAPSP